MDEISIVAITEIIGNLGTPGVLLVLLYTFMKGLIMPKDVVDKILEESHAQTLKLANEVNEGLERAVERGIRAGINGHTKK